MRYDKLSRIEFYFCYLQQCFSIDLFSYWTTCCGQKHPMNKVCLSSCPKFSWNWLFSLFFFLKLSMMLGTPIGLCMRELGFFKKNSFANKNGENRPSLWFFECVAKFSYYSFRNLVYNESLC